jgi:hypothetical protein
MGDEVAHNNDGQSSKKFAKYVTVVVTYLLLMCNVHVNNKIKENC